MLKISDNKRYLIDQDGRPFFWLGDTAWELLHRLTREDTLRYLDTRASQGYTVIQTVAIAEFGGTDVPRPDGLLPLHDNNPATPNDAYFDHVEWVADEAANRCMHLALLPTWGKWATPWEWTGATDRDELMANLIFTPERAQAYGRYLANRFAEKSNMLWVLGGDVSPQHPEAMANWNALAAGLRDGGAKQLMTFHPFGEHSSSEWFVDSPWLDFHMLQSGHKARPFPNWEMIDEDLQRDPYRPTLDAEPCYENVGIGQGNVGLFHGQLEVRVAAYSAVFHGAFGHTYGCNEIFQMKGWGDEPVFGGRGYWFRGEYGCKAET